MSGPEEEVKKERQASAEEDSTDEERLADDAEASVGEPEQQIEQLLAEVVKYKDLALRAEAEMQNVRRRAERDVENAHKYGSERFIQNILPVVDGLEKALEADTREDDPVIEGVRLTYKLMRDLLVKESVAVINPEGEPFDPNLHEAMSIVENPEMEPNSVVAVVQKGYKLNDRLVRPAMVMVSKTPE